MTPEQKLDEVLKYISIIKEPPYRFISDIIIERPDFKEFDNYGYSDELYMILQKLVIDGYAHVELRQFPHAKIDFGKVNAYYATFEGRYFLDKGGYVQQAKDEIIRREMIEAENSRRIRNDQLLTQGSLWAARGAVGLVVWEILKTVYHHCF